MEQLTMADILVIYDDVSFSKGSFTNRVQIKTQSGIQWLTIPVKHQKNVNIVDTSFAEKPGWKKKHIETFRQAYAKAEFLTDATAIMERVYSFDTSFCELVVASMQHVMDYLDITPQTLKSSQMDIKGSGSHRVLEICKSLGADTYLTGHGAIQYLDHEAFESEDIRVEYMNYSLPKTTQLHGEFTPYVSILDLIANQGAATKDCLKPGSVDWKEFANKAH